MSVPELGGAAWAQRTLAELGAVLCDGGSAWAELLSAGVSARKVASLYPFELTEWLAGAKRLQREDAAQRWLVEHGSLVKQLIGHLPSTVSMPLYQQIAQVSAALPGAAGSPNDQTLGLLLALGLVHLLTQQPFEFTSGVMLDSERIAALLAESFSGAATAYAEQIEVLLSVVKSL